MNSVSLVIFALCSLSAVKSVQSFDNANDIKARMQTISDWFKVNAVYNHDSAFHASVASGVLYSLSTNFNSPFIMDQLSFITTFLHEAKVQLPTNKFLERYDSAELWQWVSSCSEEKTITSDELSSWTPAKIVEDSIRDEEQLQCIADFYADNVFSTTERTCVISAECLAEATVDLSNPEDEVIYRNCWYFYAKYLGKCTNYDATYAADTKEQISYILKQLLKLYSLNPIKDEYRINILDKIIYGRINGYCQFIDETALSFVNSLYNVDGYCGLVTDDATTKSTLTIQCYVILALELITLSV